MQLISFRKHLLNRQIWLAMKLMIFLMTAAFLQVSASGNSQTVNYSGKEVSLKKVFNVIKSQTGSVFFYDVELLRDAKPVTVDLKNVSLETALNEIFKDQQLTWVMENRTITIVKKQASVIKGIIDTEVSDPPQIDVKGRVVNEKGEPLEGVTVTVKGTRIATATNGNGEFVLSGVNKSAKLVFSGVNVETTEMSIDNRTDLNVTLKTKISEMMDVALVVNTGFQTISKERATGSFTVISKEQLEKPTTNIAQRLIGTTAGVQGKLDVNGNPTFEIRGQTSLFAQQQPLIVVDGFPVQGDFTSINPNDVETVTILKDAAAASIWGARSANGVIVITTKSAKKGTPLKVELNAFTRIGRKFDLDYVRPLAPSDQTVEYEKLAYANWRTLQNPISINDNFFAFSQAGTALNEFNFGFITAAQRDATLESLKTLDNRGQISDFLLANPVNTQYNLTLSGSSGRMSNFISLMYEDNQSNFKETTNKRYMVNFRTNAEVFKWMNFNFSGMLLANQSRNNGVSLGDIQDMSPYDMLVNTDGSYTDINRYYTPVITRLVPSSKFPYANWTYNPVQEIANRDLRTDQLNTRLQAGFNFKIIKGLTFDTKGQFELFNTSNKGVFNDNTFFVRQIVNQASSWNQSTNAVTPNLPKGSILTQSRSKVQSYNWRNQVNYNNVFATKHEVNFLAGAEINNVVTELFGNPTTYGYNNQTLTTGLFPNGPGGTFFQIKNWLGNNQTFSYSNSFSYRTERYFSAYANGAYTYNKKYTLSGSYRTDASNLITDDPKYRYAPFWSVGLGWQIYKENFMSAIKWVDMMNVRATFGYNGNVDRSTSFRPLIATAGSQNIYTGDYTATVSSFGNPTLRWEKTRTWNVGLDYSLFRGKLSGKIDIYNKYGKDLIAQLSIPAINGTTNQRLNNAEMSNKGIELELGTYMKIAKELTWRGNLNFSYNKNKIEKLFVARYPASTLSFGGTGAYVVGEDANSLWRFIYAGVINDQPRVVGADGTTYDFTAFTPGDGRDYMKNTGTLVAPYTLGFSSAFQYKDFNLSFIVTGKFGHIFQRLGFNYPPTWTSRVLPNIKLSEVMNGKASDIVPLPYNPNEGSYFFWDRFHRNLSYLVENASHIRMQELNLSYALPKSLLSKFNMSRLQLYAQGNDLFTIYANKAKEDPEYPLGTMNPRPKITFGIKCEF